jgi:hypothetical protein
MTISQLLRSREQFFWMAAMLIFGVSSFAQDAPKLLPFQGRLTDQNGNMVTNGVRLVQFKIYDAPSAGNAVWAGEIHRTTVNGGLVNVLLGTKTSLNGVDFDRTLYLEITVDVSGLGGQTDGATAYPAVRIQRTRPGEAMTSWLWKSFSVRPATRGSKTRSA